MPRDAITTARQRCARWALALWRDGVLPAPDRARCGRILRDIANGADARDVLGVRYAGRPRKLDIPALAGEPHAGGGWLTFADGGRAQRTPAAQALAVAARGDVTQGRWLLGMAACVIEQGAPLPEVWGAWLALALHAVASGADARRALLLVRPRGNKASPLRDEEIRRIQATLRAHGYPAEVADGIAGEIAESFGMVSRVGARRVRQIRRKVPE